MCPKYQKKGKTIIEKKKDNLTLMLFQLQNIFGVHIMALDKVLACSSILGKNICQWGHSIIRSIIKYLRERASSKIFFFLFHFNKSPSRSFQNNIEILNLEHLSPNNLIQDKEKNREKFIKTIGAVQGISIFM